MSAERIVKVASKDIVADVDGYFAYWVEGGSWRAADLRVIADHLDELNAPWDAQVKAYEEER